MSQLLSEQIPSQKGTYLLQMICDEPTVISVGKLGSVYLKAGFYHYCGSALGPGGLKARLGHHLKKSTNPHWHLDYLRKYLSVRSIWWTTDPLRRECEWAALLTGWRSASTPIQGFGASDCTCRSHLVYLPYSPSLSTFRKRWRTKVPEGRVGRLFLQ